MVGKGENAGYQHFLLSPTCFQKSSFRKGLLIYRYNFSTTFPGTVFNILKLIGFDIFVVVFLCASSHFLTGEA